MPRTSLLALLVLAALVVAAGLGAPAAANGMTSVCPVCGGDGTTAWDDTSYDPPETSRISIKVHANGSATWTADLEWRDGDRAPGPDDPHGDATEQRDEQRRVAGPDDDEAVREMTREALADSPFLPAAEAVQVEIPAEGRATVRWRTPGVVERRFGQGVLTLFRSTGGADPPFLNAEELVVRTPDGTVITNEPAAGTVTEDRTALRYAGPGYVDDFYVVYGESSDGLAPTLAVASLVWPRTAVNGVTILGPAAVAFAIGLAGLDAVGRRRETVPDRATVKLYAGLGLGLGALLVGGILLAAPGGRPAIWAAAAVCALVGVGGVGYLAATGDRRRAAGAAAVVYLLVVGPFVAREWPLVDLHPLYVAVATRGLLGFSVVLVLLGAPAYLVGDALARRHRPRGAVD